MKQASLTVSWLSRHGGHVGRGERAVFAQRENAMLDATPAANAEGRINAALEILSKSS